jgi:polar amino acid transport system substrate-binding protein
MAQYNGPFLRLIAAVGVMTAGLAFIVPPSGASADPAASLPAKYKDGITVVTSNGTSPPFSYHPNGDPGTYEGIDPDLIRAIGAKLGVPIKFSSSDFAGMIPAVIAGRYDLALFGITDNAAREQQVDMIDYLSAGTSIIVARGNPLGIKSLADLCGKNVAVVAASSQLAIVQRQTAQCATPINISEFPTKAETYLQMQTGRADASMDGTAAAQYLDAHPVETSKAVQPVPGVNLDVLPLGVVVSKNAPELRDAVVAAFNAIMEDGTYKQILEKWGTPGIAIDKITVNGAAK